MFIRAELITSITIHRVRWFGRNEDEEKIASSNIARDNRFLSSTLDLLYTRFMKNIDASNFNCTITLTLRHGKVGHIVTKSFEGRLISIP